MSQKETRREKIDLLTEGFLLIRLEKIISSMNLKKGNRERAYKQKKNDKNRKIVPKDERKAKTIWGQKIKSPVRESQAR
jgi:hypothetical protein